MIGKALALVVVVAVAGMMGLLALGLVTAQEADLSRSLPADPVAPDDAFAVTINNVGLADGFGSVVETLPAGFSYVDTSAASTDANAVIDAEVDGPDCHLHRSGGGLVHVQSYSPLGRGGWPVYFLRRFEEAKWRGDDCRFHRYGGGWRYA